MPSRLCCASCRRGARAIPGRLRRWASSSEDPPDDQDNPNLDGSDQQSSGSDSNQNTQQSSDADADDNSSEEGGLAPQPAALSPQEQEELSVQWQQRLAGAAQQALQSGKLEGDMARMVDFLLQPQLPWRNLVSRYLNSIARDR